MPRVPGAGGMARASSIQSLIEQVTRQGLGLPNFWRAILFPWCCMNALRALVHKLIHLISMRSCKENRPSGCVGVGEGCAVLSGVCVTQAGYVTRATRCKTLCPVSLVAQVPAVVGARGRTGGCAASDGLRRSERLQRARCHALLLQKRTCPRAQELGRLLVGLSNRSSGRWPWPAQVGHEPFGTEEPMV